MRQQILASEGFPDEPLHLIIVNAKSLHTFEHFMKIKSFCFWNFTIAQRPGELIWVIMPPTLCRDRRLLTFTLLYWVDFELSTLYYATSHWFWFNASVTEKDQPKYKFLTHSGLICIFGHPYSISLISDAACSRHAVWKRAAHDFARSGLHRNASPQ